MRKTYEATKYHVLTSKERREIKEMLKFAEAHCSSDALGNRPKNKKHSFFC